MSEWKVQRSRLDCKQCQEEIVPGSEFWSRLVQNTVSGEGEEPLIREDYCQACWPVEGNTFCFWKTTRMVEEHKGPRMLDPDTMLTIFRELPESKEPRKINFRYLLALILMRKKILREYKKGQPVLKLTDTVTEWDVEIPDMDIEARKIAEEDIGQLIVGLPEVTVEGLAEDIEQAQEGQPQSQEETVEEVSESSEEAKLEEGGVSESEPVQQA